jgi:uncharacterized lipoprotein YmbA
MREITEAARSVRELADYLDRHPEALVQGRHWAGPLGDMTRRVLSQDLAAHVPKNKLVLPGAPSPPDTTRIVVSVVQFGANPDGNVVLRGS